MSFSFRRLFVVALVGGLSASCGGRIDAGQDGGGSDASPPPPSSDASPPPPTVDAGPPPVWDGGDCNNVPILGQAVTFNQIAANAPPFPSNGSPIFQGVYVLISFTNYTGPGGSSTPLGVGQVSVQVSGAKDGFDFQSVALIDNQAPQRSSSIGKITAPNQLTFSSYCPTTASGSPAYYYFDGSTLWLRASNGVNDVDEQYTLVTN